MPTFTRRDLLRTGLAVSASTLVTGPLGRANALLSGYPLCALQETSHSIAPRQHLLLILGGSFTGSWRGSPAGRGIWHEPGGLCEVW